MNLITISCFVLGGLIAIGCAFVFWEIYRQAHQPECPYCGERNGRVKTKTNRRKFCAFCGNPWPVKGKSTEITEPPRL